MNESDLMRAIQIAVSHTGARVFRNNCGTARTEDGRFIRFGLFPGSSDLIGWTRQGRFLCLEIKMPGKRATLLQQAFINAVNQAGGLAFVATSVEDALNKLNT